MPAGVAAGEADGPRREVEGFAMPVEGEKLGGKGERSGLRARAIDRVPTDLLVRAGVDAGTECARDELRA